MEQNENLPVPNPQPEEQPQDLTPAEPYKFDQNKILEEVDRISNALMIGYSVTEERNGVKTTVKKVDGEPFYAHFFTSLVKRVANDVDTLAVGYHNNLVTLHIGPKFWNEHLVNTGFKLGGIKHEILHIVFKHIFRYKGFSHKTLFNVAADLVVNQCIDPEQLIEGCVMLEKFPELNLKPHEHTNYYYNALLELYNKCTSPDCSEGDKESESWKNLRSFLDENDQNQRRHALWKKIDDLTNAEKDILESAINQNLENSLQRTKHEHYGKLPAGLKQYLEEFKVSQIPVVNWRRMLRLFANSSSKTRIRNTLRRPSKRYGTNPGIKVKKKQKLLVAIDTSGSISQDELREFFNEIYHIWKQGTEVMVVECDTVIGSTYAYKGKTPQNATGGGGTDFEAPIIWANLTYRPDALVYFTDAYGPNPRTKCLCPMLWMVSKNGDSVENIREFQGRKVKMT
jgi:predicted metal-dependent peptidase